MLRTKTKVEYTNELPVWARASVHVELTKTLDKSLRTQQEPCMQLSSRGGHENLYIVKLAKTLDKPLRTTKRRAVKGNKFPVGGSMKFCTLLRHIVENNKTKKNSEMKTKLENLQIAKKQKHSIHC